MPELSSPSTPADARSKTSREKRIFLGLSIFLVATVVAPLSACKKTEQPDQPAQIVQIGIDDFNIDVDSTYVDAMGKVLPDCHYWYEELQEEACNPVEKNGWRLLLAAYGPKALKANWIDERILWEDVLTNRISKEWFEKLWEPICIKMDVNPTVKPTFFGRLSPVSFLVQRGANDQEPISEYVDFSSLDESSFYYEAGRRRQGRITVDEANAIYQELISRPWSEEECPTLARWIDENADQYDLLARAARQPKFACWHIAPEYPGTMSDLLLPDVLALRELVHILSLRMNLRIGAGNLSEALDDFETQLLFSKSIICTSRSCYNEHLVALAIMREALSAPFFYSPDRSFSAEERARYLSFVRDFTEENTLSGAGFSQGERIVKFGTLVDALRSRRDGSDILKILLKGYRNPKVFEEEENSALVSEASEIMKNLPVNDAKCFEQFMELWDVGSRNQMNSAELRQYVNQWASEQKNGRYGSSASLTAVCCSLLVPDFHVVYRAFNQHIELFRMAIVGEALLAYQNDHGALPPAFTRDVQGRPLHSWRVLILPYLGEKEKALYDQIRLDEPWDSEYNSQFHESMPTLYDAAHLNSVKQRYDDGLTQLTVFLGDDQFFDESGVGKDWRRCRENKDALKQALVVERATPICWMQPDAELRCEELKAELEKTASERNLLKGRGGSFSCYTVSGAVKTFMYDSTPEEWNKLVFGRAE